MTRMILADGMVGTITEKEHRRIVRELKTVPYRKTKNGEMVTTCGLDEEALGLDEVICGWNPKGFYLKRNVSRFAAEAVLSLIDWDRVAQIQQRFFPAFEKSAPRNGKTSSKLPYAVSFKRYQHLIRQCLNDVSLAKFIIEIKRADAIGRKTKRPV